MASSAHDAVDCCSFGAVSAMDWVLIARNIQGTLPQWASVRGERVYLNRKEHKRHKDARLTFNPQLVCTVNWADSGPGFSWPESYHVTYLPGFDTFVITASRDGPDAWGVLIMPLAWLTEA